MSLRVNVVAIAFLPLAACLPKHQIHQRAVDEVYKGYDYLKQDDLERAGVAFNHALEFNDDFPEAWNGLGVIELRKGNLDAAKGYFERAIRINNDFAEGHNNLGLVYRKKERLSAAEDEFQAALKVNPDFLDARFNLAQTLLREGLTSTRKRKDYWRRARQQYLHLLEANPQKADAYHDLGYMAYESGDFEEAEREYRKATDLAPNYMEALHGECISLGRLGRCDEAVRYCQHCLEVSPGVPECKQSLAAVQRCSVGDLPSPSGAGGDESSEDAE